MKDKVRDTIIDDLLKKRPVGPPGGPKLTYSSREEFNYDRGRYVTVLDCSDNQYGYDDASLFSLGIRSKADAKSYIRTRFFDGQSDWNLRGKKSTLTRRANRIWHRIEAAVLSKTLEGGKGIYSVTRKYSSIALGYVYSLNPEEALTMAEMFFPNKNSDDYAVKFVEIGDVDRLYVYNAEIRSSYEAKIKRNEERIKEFGDEIQSIQSHITMLTVLEGHQIAVESGV